jgi:hypothetical protein
VKQRKEEGKEEKGLTTNMIGGKDKNPDLTIL